MDNYQNSNENVVNMTILDQTRLLSEGYFSLSSLLENLSGFLQELSNLGIDASKRNSDNILNLEETAEMACKIIENAERLHTKIPSLVKSLNESDTKIKQYQEKLESVESKLNESNSSLVSLKEREESMKKESIVQANYTATMGSIMGAMLWKTSKTEEVINTFINEEMISDFIIMADITMKSFIESYKTEFPSPETHEYKFSMSILGTSINIAAQKSGRDFVLGEEVGISYVRNILGYLPDIKMPAGSLIKRLILIFLFNICISKRGAKLVQDNVTGIKSILKCLAPSYTGEIHSIVLSLLKALVEDFPNKEFCQQIITMTSRDDLQSLMDNGDDTVKRLVADFHKVFELGSPTSR